MDLSPEEKQEVQDSLRRVAQILCRHTPSNNLQTFEDIETTLREQIQQEISPEIAEFFFRS